MPKVTEEHIEARRRQILEAAFRCFARKGFHPATMHDICTEAELSPGAVYHYFSSKEDIILASCNESQDRDLLASLTAQADTPTAELLARMSDAFLLPLGAPEALPMVRASVQMWAEMAVNDRVRAGAQEAVEQVAEGLRQVVAQGQARGDLDSRLDPLAVAHVLMAVYEGLFIRLASTGTDVAQFNDVVKALLTGSFWTGRKAAKVRTS